MYTGSDYDFTTLQAFVQNHSAFFQYLPDFNLSLSHFFIRRPIHPYRRFFLVLKNSTQWNHCQIVASRFIIDRYIHTHTCRQRNSRIRSQPQTHLIKLIQISLFRHIDQFQRKNPIRKDIGNCRKPVKKVTTDIIAGRHIDFYLEITGIDHRYNRHSGSHRFVGIEIFLLDIPIERSDKPGIFQSIFMRIIFRGDLLQTIHRFIVIIFRYTFTVIQFNHPFSLGFNLFVFGFGSFILQFIIPRVDLCNHFSFTHKTTHLHRNPDDRSGYPKCQIYVGRSLNTPRIGHL